MSVCLSVPILLFPAMELIQLNELNWMKCNETNEMNEMNEMKEMNYVSSLVGLCISSFIALCLLFYSSIIALELSECWQIVCYTLEVRGQRYYRLANRFVDIPTFLIEKNINQKEFAKNRSDQIVSPFSYNNKTKVLYQQTIW